MTSTSWPPFPQPPRPGTNSPETEAQWRDVLWKIVTQLVANSDGFAPVVARASLTTAQAGIVNKAIPFNVVGEDTHSGFAAGIYTVSEPGDYLVTGNATFGALDGSTDAKVQIRKNSVSVCESFASRHASDPVAGASARIVDILPALVAGDTIDIFALGDASFDLDSNGKRCWVAIMKVPGT